MDKHALPLSFPSGSVRAVNIRGESDFRAQPDETLVMADRSNPALGNPHRMLEQSRKERERVIEIYAKETDEAIARQSGPRYEAILALAGRVSAGEKVALGCWCSPAPCHADVIAARVWSIAQKLSNEASSPARESAISKGPRS